FYERRVAHRHRGVHRGARADAVLLERLHHAEDADAVAVVAQRVVAEVRVGGLQRAERLEGLALLVEREPFQRDGDPEGDARLAGPLDRFSIRQDRPRIAAVVHPVAPPRVLEIVVRYGQWAPK